MNQLCKVCAEPAAGFHFGAFTCEGCKSFFGRTYNNLSQIHECKNGRQCVINKQNRTSCKACRLRKCLDVGMSKTGSRYGRRSNWFKIHCILQEQCGYTNPPNSNLLQTFRTPVTPTLQDGSLPFVNSHLRDSMHSMDSPQVSLPSGELTSTSGAVTRLPVSSPTSREGVAVTSALSGAGSQGIASDSAHRFTASIAMGQIGMVERRLQEEALNALRRGASLPPTDLEATYREQLLEAIRKSQCYQTSHQFDSTPSMDSLRRPSTDSEQLRRMGAEIDRVRRVSAETDGRLTSSSSTPFDWRIQEENESHKPTSPRSTKASAVTVTSSSTCSQASCMPLKLPCSGSDIDALSKCTSAENSGQGTLTSVSISPSRLTPKSKSERSRIQDDTESPMTEEERLSFLKSASKISSSANISRDSIIPGSFPGLPNILPHRSSPREDALYSPLNKPPRDDILYSPINNNIFPFASYPPVWPSLLPFPSLAKFYPPIAPAALPTPPLSFDGSKNPVFFPPDLRSSMLSHSPLEMTKDEDSSSKKRIIDAILQVQRESPPLSAGLPIVSSPDVSLSQIVSTASLVSSTPTTSGGSHGDQPIDLTVRRKRKMAKNEIVFKPGEDREEEDMESEYDREEEQLIKDESEVDITKELLVKTASELAEIKTSLECSTSAISDSKFEVPIKMIKLENTNDTLLA